MVAVVVRDRPKLEIQQALSLWGTFESVREHLYRQHQDVSWGPETGLSLPELERAV